MEYRGIRYTLRAGVKRGVWVIGIRPESGEGVERAYNGSRGAAEIMAHLMIDKWLKSRVAQLRKIQTETMRPSTQGSVLLPSFP